MLLYSFTLAIRTSSVTVAIFLWLYHYVGIYYIIVNVRRAFDLSVSASINTSSYRIIQDAVYNNTVLVLTQLCWQPSYVVALVKCLVTLPTSGYKQIPAKQAIVICLGI